MITHCVLSRFTPKWAVIVGSAIATTTPSRTAMKTPASTTARIAYRFGAPSASM